MLRTYLAAFVAFGLIASSAPSHAIEEKLIVNCKPQVKEKNEKVECQLRNTASGSLSDIKVTDGDDEELSYEIEPYSWTNHESAFYFVVQTDNLSTDRMEEISAFLERAGYPVGKQALGIGLSGTDLKKEARLGSYRPELERLARSFATRESTSQNTKILEHLSDAVDTVAGRASTRRAIVVLSETSPPAGALDEKALVSKARKNGVAIYFVTFGSGSAEPSGTIKDIAKKTWGGVFNMAGATQASILEVASSLFSYLENGSIIRIDATGMPADLSLTVSAELEETKKTETKTVYVARITEDDTWVSLKNSLSNNLFIILALLGIAAGGLLIFRSKPEQMANAVSKAGASMSGATANLKKTIGAAAGKTIGKGAASDDEDAAAPGEAGETVILKQPDASNGDKPIVWLELTGSEIPRLPLFEGSHKLGRASDNDIRLTDKSVHRKHAILNIVRGGTISIHDLGTQNGVFVNGTRYSQRDLEIGDTIELGDAKLRLCGTATG